MKAFKVGELESSLQYLYENVNKTLKNIIVLILGEITMKKYESL